MVFNHRQIWILLVLCLLNPELLARSDADSTQSDYYFAQGRRTANNQQYDSAKWYWSRSRDLYEQEENWIGYVRSQNDLASLVIQIDDDADSAVSLLQYTLDRTQSKFDTLPEAIAITHDFLAGAYTNLGDFDKALENDLKALEVARLKLGEIHRRLAISHTNIANTYYGKKNYAKALYHCQRSLAINQQLEKPHQQLGAFSYSTMLGIYKQTEDLPKIREYTELVLIQFREAFGAEGLSMANKYTDVVGGLLLLKEYDKARDYQRRSINLLKQWPNRYHDNRRNALTNMGSILKHMGEYDSALFYLDRAWAIVEEQDQSHYNVLSIFNTQANVLDSLKNYKQSEAVYEVQREYILQHFPTDTLRRAEFHANLAHHHRHIGQFTQALNTCQQGLNMLSSEEAKDVFQVPSLNTLTNKRAAFTILAEKSRTLYQQLVSDRNSQSRSSTVDHLKATLTLLDQLKRQHPTDHSRIFMYQENRDLNLALVDCLIREYEANGDLAQLQEAFQFAAQSQSLRLRESLNDSEAQRFAGIPDEVLNIESESRRSITFYRQRLERLMTRDNASDDPRVKLWTEKIVTEQNRLDSLQNHFKESYPEYFSLKYQDQGIPLTDLQKSLVSDKQALINYVWSDTTLYLFLVTKGGIQVAQTPAGSDLSQQIKSFRHLMQSQASNSNGGKDFARMSHQLYQLLIDPISDHLAGIEQLVIIPDGWLAWVPFDVLVQSLPEANQGFRDYDYLIKKFTISYAYAPDLWVKSSAQQLTGWQQQYAGFAPSYDLLALQESPELLAYGEYRDALGALKFTSQEVTEAHNYFSGSLFLNNEASEGTFKALEGSAQILHLAMHALVDEENPLRSKLIFSQSADTTDDGFLHAYELYNLRLNAELAVLSACNTGFGPLSEGEGVTSLSRAFSYAGCKSIVMSLWPAQDKSTLDIMSLFYKGLSEGLSKDQALRQAKLQYLENADDLFASPFFWANFVVSGNTQPLTQKTPWVYYLLGALGLAFAGFMGYRMGKPKKT